MVQIGEFEFWDLLHQRYASPFSFIDSMILANRFGEFVNSFMKKVYEEKNERLTWEFFLHRVYDKSFNEFKEDMKNDAENQNMSEEDVETTIKHTMNILNSFNPEEGGE